MTKTISFRFDDSPESQAFADTLLTGLKINRARQKTILIQRILNNQKVTVEDLTQSAEFPEIQSAIAKGFVLSIPELKKELEKGPKALTLKVFNELSHLTLRL